MATTINEIAGRVTGMIEMMFFMRKRRGQIKTSVGTLDWEPGYNWVDVDVDEPDGTTDVVLYVSPCDEDEALVIAEVIADVSDVPFDSIYISPTDCGDCEFEWSIDCVWNERKGW